MQLSEINNGISFDIQSNPFKKKLNIFINSNMNESIKVEVRGYSCRLIIEQTEEVKTGSNKISVSDSKLNEGIFFITMITNESVITQKVVYNNW